MVANDSGTMMKWNSNVDPQIGIHCWGKAESKWRVVAGGKSLGKDVEIDELIKVKIMIDERRRTSEKDATRLSLPKKEEE